MPKISVIMPTYRENISVLDEAVNSILSQTYSDFELIVMLDDPGNKEHIQYFENLSKKDARIKFHVNEVNLGLSKSLNNALNYVQGEYIARMDADDVSVSDRLANQLSYIEENQFDMIGGILMVIDEQGEKIYDIQSVPTDDAKIKKALKYNQVIAHPSWFCRKEVFTSLKGYRSIPLCEDTDFTLRAALKGFKLSNYDGVVLKYRMTSNSISRSNLLKQFLYLKFITKDYKNKKVSNIDEATSYVNSKWSEKSEKHYRDANVLFNDALSNLQKKRYLKLMISCIKLLFKSKYYLEKTYRLVRVSMF